MKTTQYGRQEGAIAAADSGTIRERWLYGLRLLADAEKIAPAGGLKHSVTDALIAVAAKRGVKLSAREIQWRLQCARAYPTEAQIRNAITDFETWFALIQANFPRYEAPDGEPPADFRTAQEQKLDRARALAELADATDPQGTLFPLDTFEPSTSTLKELEAYAVEQAELTGRFVERDKKRREYLDRLIEAADNDLSVTWQEAHNRLDPEDADPAQVSAA